MRSALVLIKTKEDGLFDAVKAVREIKEVESALVVSGEFDIVATVKGATVDDIADIVNLQIQSIETVSSTKTLLVADEQYND
jgi:DNA-binding Lrp family transcriptional regulator